jgi:hypothetical protein
VVALTDTDGRNPQDDSRRAAPGPAVATLHVSSGRTWERVTRQAKLGGHVNNVVYVQTKDEPRERGYFKWPKATQPLTSLYSIGIEHVHYVLAEKLDIPVCPTYLEQFEDHDGLISIVAPNSKAWAYLEQDIIDSRATFIDRDKWPVALALDVVLGNIDRHGENIYVQWDPPQRPRTGEECATWFIDFGHSGLWPPAKFDETFNSSDLLKIDAAAPVRPEMIDRYRGLLPPQLRMAFPRAGSERTEVIETVCRITDDDVREAVENVPAQYIDAKVADLTIRWISGRLPQVDTLLDEVFPA